MNLAQIQSLTIQCLINNKQFNVEQFNELHFIERTIYFVYGISIFDVTVTVSSNLTCTNILYGFFFDNLSLYSFNYEI